MRGTWSVCCFFNLCFYALIIIIGPVAISRCASITCTDDRIWLTHWLIETGDWQFRMFHSSPTTPLVFYPVWMSYLVTPVNLATWLVWSVTIGHPGQSGHSGWCSRPCPSDQWSPWSVLSPCSVWSFWSGFKNSRATKYLKNILEIIIPFLNSFHLELNELGLPWNCAIKLQGTQFICGASAVWENKLENNWSFPCRL